jgi:hypothetical protein
MRRVSWGTFCCIQLAAPLYNQLKEQGRLYKLSKVNAIANLVCIARNSVQEVSWVNRSTRPQCRQTDPAPSKQRFSFSLTKIQRLIAP